MTVFEWLNTGTGQDLVHALIVLILAVSGWITYRAKVRLDAADAKLDQHIQDTTDSVTGEVKH
jgi:hypothetical protein